MRAILRRCSWLLFLGLSLAVLDCKDIAEAPTGLAYSTNPAVYTVGTAIPANSPTHGGGKIDAYTVSPALPDGLSLNTTSGVITGTPNLAAAVATYTVTGSNSAGSTTASLSVTVNDKAQPITITTQPANQSILVGQTATFSVVATGTTALSYLWSRDGVVLAGATAADYTTPTAVLADNGSTYSVDISDTNGNVLTSASATLTVVAAAGPGTFTPTGGMSAARTYATATLLANGKVLVVGGASGAQVLSSADLYDSATGTFTATGSMATARRFHTATLLADGTVLVVGGSNASTTAASAELYNPATGTFSATGSLLESRADHTATRLPDGRVLVAGGGAAGVFRATAEVYDPATGTFTITTGAPIALRAAHTATLLGNGKVLLAAGRTAGLLSSAELYDPATGTFAATGGLAVPRAYHTATTLANGQVLMVGGAATAAAELYNPTTGTFVTTGSLVTGRYSHAAALLPTGQVLVCGGLGLGSPAPLLPSAELFDPANGTFTATGSLAVARELHTATTLGDGKVLVAGGYSGVSYLASAELYY